MTFEERVKSMSAKEIIMAMVEGLRDPKIEVDMGTFGRDLGGICYGCAATNTICHITGKKFTSDNIAGRGMRAEVIDTSVVFIRAFEEAIDHLRSGTLSFYNIRAVEIGISLIIKKGGLELPYLMDDYTDEELQKYVELAEYQHEV